MRTRIYILLFLLGLIVSLAVGKLENAPGYMDADYYYAGGISLASGRGLTEPFLWNYLDDPTGLPHPAFTYWMPLASLLAAAGMALTGEADFFSARLIFFLLAGLIPVITAWLAYELTHRRTAAWTAAGLGLASGFYVVYLGLTETLTLYMLLGTLFLFLASRFTPVLQKSLGLGVIAGLMHLARADGLLWAGAGLLVVGVDAWRMDRRRWALAALGSAGVLLVGYFGVTGFWYGRNLTTWGSLFPPGNGRALWMTNYDQLYDYPATGLNFQDWIAAGLPTILQLRWDALVANLQTFLAVQGSVFLTPLILLGFWRLRRSRLVQLGGGMWLLTFIAMTVVFPLAGSRGGFLHSGAAFAPLFWTLSAEGLMGFIDLGVRWRNWKPERASVGFGILIISVSLVLTLGITVVRISGDEAGQGWQASWDEYRRVDQVLDQAAIPAETLIMVNNPPGFYVASGRPSIAIPNGDMAILMSAAQKYKAKVLVLEENSVKDLRGLYAQPRSLPGLRYITPAGKAYIFEITTP